MTICLGSAWDHLLDQLQTLRDPRTPRDTILFISTLDGEAHALMTICGSSHLRRILSLMADRRDQLLAMTPARKKLTIRRPISLAFVQVKLLAAAMCNKQ